jgi:DNA-binding transcriptional LysR family regulator
LLIGASTTLAEFLLPRIVGEFKARHAGVVPRLLVANSEQVQEKVAERSLDVGFIEGDSHLASLVTEAVCEDELFVVCAPGHSLANHSAITPALLAEHAYIGREAGSGTREVIDNYLRKAGLSLESLNLVMEASSPEALKGLVVTGLGFSIMSGATVDLEARHDVLVRIPLAPRLIRQLSVVTAKERIHARVVSDFVAFAKVRLASPGGERRLASA